MEKINYLICIVSGFAIGIFSAFFILSDQMPINYQQRVEDAEKNSRIKDSLYLNCNGKISTFKESFMYKNYVENTKENP